MADKTEIETRNLYGTIYAGKNGIAYSSRTTEAFTEIGIDARGDHVYISMTEQRATGRTTGASISFTREQWEEIKRMITEAGGNL